MEDFLSELEGLKITCHRRPAKGGSGVHRGRGSGISLDFYGQLPYTPGQDVRKIDWKAYGRTEHLYIKEFSEDRQSNINVILDSSASMDFGSPSKWDSAKLIALGISYIALKQGDRLNFYTINENASSLCKSSSGRDYFYELVRVVENTKPIGHTDFSIINDIDAFNSGITFLISDFMTDQNERVFDYLGGFGQETAVIHIMSEWERNPGLTGEWKLKDKETGAERRVILNKSIKERYIKRINGFMTDINKYCMDRGFSYFFALSEEKPSSVLQRILGATT